MELIVDFALPDFNRLCLADFPLHLPFQLLGIRKTLRLLICLLLEQKVIINLRMEIGNKFYDDEYLLFYTIYIFLWIL